MRAMTELGPRTQVGLAAFAAIAVGTVSLLATPAGETVASFVDLEHGNGIFTSGKWNVQGNATADVSASSSEWKDHFTSASTAIFQPALGTVIPGSTRSYSRFGLRMAPGSMTGATVTIPTGAETPTGKASSFQMRVVRTVSDVCSATTFTTASPEFVVGTAGSFENMLSAPTGITTVTLGAGTSNTAGSPVYLCYEFSLPLSIPPDLNNGDTATVSWTFNAVSS